MSATIDDPTLASLVPARRRLQMPFNALGVGLVLLGAWFLPPVFRPTIKDAGAGSWGPVEVESALVQATVTVRAEWPGVTITTVRAPGATAVGAWLVPGEYDEYDGSTPPDDINRLPQRLRPGTPANLVILWRIDECDELMVWPEGVVHDDFVPLELEGRTVLGTPSAIRIDDLSPVADFLGPAFDYDLLTGTGICPPRSDLDDG